MAHIMVVDDEDDIREVVKITLETRGHQVSVAENGREALRLLQEERLPDAVILDVMMPDMNGLEMVQRMRAHQLWRQIPVLMLTAVTEHSQETDDAWRERMKVADYITKPFDTLDLLKRVEQLTKVPER